MAISNLLTTIKITSKTSEEWTTENPILELGTGAHTIGTLDLKIGDGITRWIDLPVDVLHSTTPPHKNTHIAGGRDALTPEDLNAADRIHTHTPDEAGAAPAVHSHIPADIGAANKVHTHTPEEAGAAAEHHTHIPTECGAAPTVHSHIPEDIDAADRVHGHTPAQVGLGNIPNAISDAIDLDAGDTLATSKAVRDVAVLAAAAQSSADTANTGLTTKSDITHTHTTSEVGITSSTGAPTGGNDGDIWLVV